MTQAICRAGKLGSKQNLKFFVFYNFTISPKGKASICKREIQFVVVSIGINPLADLGGGVPGAHNPLRDPILSFLQTFSPKSTHVGGPCSPNGCTPSTGNPGSATEIYKSCGFFTTNLGHIRQNFRRLYGK